MAASSRPARTPAGSPTAGTVRCSSPSSTPTGSPRSPTCTTTPAVSLEQTSPFGRVTTYRYDATGMTVVAGDDGVRQAMVHDRRGNLTAVVDTDGTAMRLTYDTSDRVVQVVERDGAEWRYEYDEPRRPRRARRSRRPRPSLGRGTSSTGCSPRPTAPATPGGWSTTPSTRRRAGWSGPTGSVVVAGARRARPAGVDHRRRRRHDAPRVGHRRPARRHDGCPRWPVGPRLRRAGLLVRLVPAEGAADRARSVTAAGRVLRTERARRGQHLPLHPCRAHRRRQRAG